MPKAPRHADLLIAYHAKQRSLYRRSLIAIGLISIVSGLFMSYLQISGQFVVEPAPANAPFWIPLTFAAIGLVMFAVFIRYYIGRELIRMNTLSLAAEANYQLCGKCMADLRQQPDTDACPHCGAIYSKPILINAWKQLYKYPKRA